MTENPISMAQPDTPRSVTTTLRRLARLAPAVILPPVRTVAALRPSALALLCGLVAFCGSLLPAAARCAAADQPSLVYQRHDTWQSTLATTLKASGLPVLEPWHQVGPFDRILRRPLPPQEDPALDAQYDLLGGGVGRWQPAHDIRDGHASLLDTSRLPPAVLAKEPTVCYRRSITAPRDTSLRIFLGCDRQFTVWLNGKPILYAGTVSSFVPGQETAELPLVAGENVLVIKVSLSAEPCRLFFLADFGADLTEDLLDRLQHDFPTSLARSADYRRQSVLQSTTAEEQFYRLAEIAAPPGVVIEGGGMAFLPDGRLAVSTRRGFVYLVENPGSDDPAQVRFQRFASGLHEGLGLAVVDSDIHVVTRGELVRLRDTDGDGLADRHECVANGWGLTGNYHEYAYGLPADARGNLYVSLNLTFAGGGGPKADAAYRGCVVRVTPQGVLEPVSCGLRSPNGIGRDARGEIFVTDNQGDWVAVCALFHVGPGRYFGHPASRHWAASLVGADQAGAEVPRYPPAVWFPYEELCQSATDVVCDTTSGAFGPFAGQLFVGEMTKGLVARVQLEQVEGRYQGACFLFRRGCGAVNRLAFGPDGRLYLSRVNRGWGGGGLGEGLARIEFTGRLPMEIQSVHLHADGFTLRFTRPLASSCGDNPDHYRLEQYGYRYWSTYGSPRVDLEAIQVTRAHVAPDRSSVRLYTRGLAAGKVCRIALVDIAGDDGAPLVHAEAWYTLNVLPAAE